MASERIVIMGGTSGIGLGVAKLFAGRGAEVILGSDRRSSMDAALAELGGLDVRGQVVDVTSEDSVSGFLGGVGEIDHLIYTAGAVLDLMPVTEIDMDVARHYHDVRCFGVLVTAKYAVSRIRHGGSIVLTSGIAGARPSSGWAVAAGTAGTIEAYTRALAVELAPVRVNAVSPGTVRTPLWSGIPEAEREAYYGHVAKTNLTRTISDPDEIAPSYAFLTDQPFATGTVLRVDGGRVLV
jgi:NAD(P)-dependent dehydrogenase (short-subunit alcohol dehydrogenase family)